MSNTERQRRFRKRNPGYYGRLHRKRKAKLQAYRAEQEAIQAWWRAYLNPKQPLMLPAPEQVSNYQATQFIRQFQERSAKAEHFKVPVTSRCQTPEGD